MGEDVLASVVAERGRNQIPLCAGSVSLNGKSWHALESCPVLPRVSGQGLPVMAGLPCLANQLLASRGDRPCVLIIWD